VARARRLAPRGGDGHATVDAQHQAGAAVPAGEVVELDVATRGNVPPDADAVFLNLTAVNPDGHGYLTAFPCGAQRPLASHVNYTPGSVSPNGVLVGVGEGGSVCIFTLATTHVLADVTAFVPAGQMPEPVVPARLLDTRRGVDNVTADGQYQQIGRIPNGHFLRLPVAGRGTVPEHATAVFLNLTAVEPLDAGYLAAWPCGEERPKASHVNYGAGEVRPNGVLVGIGPHRQVCGFPPAAPRMVVDVSAFVARAPT